MGQKISKKCVQWLLTFALLAVWPGASKAFDSSGLGAGGEPLGFTDADCQKFNGNLCYRTSSNRLSCELDSTCCTQDSDCGSTDLCHPSVCEIPMGGSTGQCHATTRPGCEID